MTAYFIGRNVNRGLTFRYLNYNILGRVCNTFRKAGVQSDRGFQSTLIVYFTRMLMYLLKI